MHVAILMKDFPGSGAAAADARRLDFPSLLQVTSVVLPATAHRQTLRSGYLRFQRERSAISIRASARPELPTGIRFQAPHLPEQTKVRPFAKARCKERSRPGGKSPRLRYSAA